MIVNSFAALTAKAPLKPFNYDLAKPVKNQVMLKITHCGLCHSDVHLIDNDWMMNKYPLVPGHEIIGEVIDHGEDVTFLKKGERVGIGWQSKACLSCRECLSGNENLCNQNEATCINQFGGFSTHIVVDSRFAFKIPKGLSSEQAAPLLCGGVTVYSPLRSFNILPHMRVGVIGIGGLGHLALQFLNAWGCEVTAFSHSPSKEKEAREFGAHHFISNQKDLEAKKGYFDFIISTATANLNWDLYLSALRGDGKICFVGIPSEPLSTHVVNLLPKRLSIVSSPIGGRMMMEEMLEFAARHQIGAQVEVFSADKVNDAITKVRENTIRYRGVLKF